MRKSCRCRPVPLSFNPSEATNIISLAPHLCEMLQASCEPAYIPNMLNVMCSEMEAVSR